MISVSGKLTPQASIAILTSQFFGFKSAMCFTLRFSGGPNFEQITARIDLPFQLVLFVKELPRLF